MIWAVAVQDLLLLPILYIEYGLANKYQAS